MLLVLLGTFEWWHFLIAKTAFRKFRLKYLKPSPRQQFIEVVKKSSALGEEHYVYTYNE